MPRRFGIGDGNRIWTEHRATTQPSDAGTAVESEITLTNQVRGKEGEYRVIAVNKVGEGEPSNTVMAVLYAGACYTDPHNTP